MIMCAFKKEKVCVWGWGGGVGGETKRELAALIHKASETCFCHLFLGPSPLWLSTSVKRPDSWAGVCHVCACRAVRWSAFTHLSFLCRYQSVGASWGDRRRHYLGNVHEHQPGGQQVRDSFTSLLCRLLSFNPAAPRDASLIYLPMTPSALFAAKQTPQTYNDKHAPALMMPTKWHVMYIFVLTDAHVPAQHAVFYHPANTTGEDTVCHKHIGSCTQIALLPSASVSVEEDTLHHYAGLFCVLETWLWQHRFPSWLVRGVNIVDCVKL